MTEGRVFTIKLPMRMKTNKSGDLESLNLNVFRNLHFYKLNYQKKAFQAYVKPLLSGLPSMEAVTLHYEVNPKGGSRLDTMNVGSIVDKFFSDALVENGIIPDDDYKHVVGNSFSFGSLHPLDPHVLVTITETNRRKETPMRILLDQDEIQAALEAYVQTMGLQGASGVELTVNGDEVQAEIIMHGVISGAVLMAPSNPNPPAQTDGQPRKRGGRVLGSKNKPKGGQADAVEGTAPIRIDLDGAGSSDGEEEGAEGGDDENGDSDLTPSQGISGVGSSLFDGPNEADGTGPEESKGDTHRGNLFGDSEDGSSETDSPDNKGLRTAEEAEDVKSKPVAARRPSIFDED